MRMPFIFFHNPEGYSNYLRKLYETMQDGFADHKWATFDDPDIVDRIEQELKKTFEEMIKNAFCEPDYPYAEIQSFADYLDTLPEDEFNEPGTLTHDS
jgi:hypothetical protein